MCSLPSLMYLQGPLYAPRMASLRPALQEEPHLNVIKITFLFHFLVCQMCMFAQAYCTLPSVIWFFFILLHDLRWISDGACSYIQIFLLLYVFHCMNVQVTYLSHYKWAFGLLLFYFLCYGSDAMDFKNKSPIVRCVCTSFFRSKDARP